MKATAIKVANIRLYVPDEVSKAQLLEINHRLASMIKVAQKIENMANLYAIKNKNNG